MHYEQNHVTDIRTGVSQPNSNLPGKHESEVHKACVKIHKSKADSLRLIPLCSHLREADDNPILVPGLASRWHHPHSGICEKEANAFG